MSVNSVSLSAATLQNLQSLQTTANLLNSVENQLSSGKRVNSAADGASAYFSSQGFLTRSNLLSNLQNNLSTSLQQVSSVSLSISDIASTVTQLTGLISSALASSSTTVRAGYASQFNALMSQLDQMVNDSVFNGTNLLNSTSTSLVVYFDESSTTSLTISGVNITSAGLGITAPVGGFSTTTLINTTNSLLTTALNTLQTDAATYGGNVTLIQTRQNFTTNLINSLQTASNNLVLADTNLEGANLIALQAQDQLGISALGISGQLAQAILHILP